ERRVSKPALLCGQMTEPSHESAGPDEVTLFYDRSKGRPGRVHDEARLIVLAGPRAGSEFTLSGVEVTVGRGPDHGVVMPDISVSPRPVFLPRAARGY